MTTRDKSDRLHQKIYDFLLYIYPLLSKYPKYEKFSLQTATRNAILEMLQDVIKWQKTATKSHLYAADTALQQSKEKLRYWLAEIERFLRDELRLELNPKTTILAAKNGIDFVGYKHRATHRKVRPDSIKRIKKTIKKYERGKITKEQLQKSIQSWTGHAGHADSYNLRKKIIILAQAAEKKGGSIS